MRRFGFARFENVKVIEEFFRVYLALSEDLWVRRNIASYVNPIHTYNTAIIRFGFLISRIIKVSIRVISLSLRLITPTSTMIILDVTNTSSNICLLLRWYIQEKWKDMTAFCLIVFWSVNEITQHIQSVLFERKLVYKRQDFRQLLVCHIHEAVTYYKEQSLEEWDCDTS